MVDLFAGANHIFTLTKSTLHHPSVNALKNPHSSSHLSGGSSWPVLPSQRAHSTTLVVQPPALSPVLPSPQSAYPDDQSLCCCWCPAGWQCCPRCGVPSSQVSVLELGMQPWWPPQAHFVALVSAVAVANCAVSLLLLLCFAAHATHHTNRVVSSAVPSSTSAAVQQAPAYTVKDDAKVLFEPLQLGELHLQHRVVMAPLTRCRAPNSVPVPAMATYYGQRASPGGLIITEATPVCQQGQG